MKISRSGLELIKKYEGCCLTAYKCVSTEKYYTIGYGHYGADVKEGMTITQAQADAYLVSDMARFEKAVNDTGLVLNQNQFDALVSFTYNCGAGNLKKLIANGSMEQIAQAIPLYNKSSGKVLAGLVRRRAEEQALFMKDMGTRTEEEQDEVTTSYKIQKGDTLSKIAQQFNTTVDTLVKLNNIPNPNKIKAGQVIRILEMSNGNCYYPAYKGKLPLAAALNSMGIDSSPAFRKKIAHANGINGYEGYYDQNMAMRKLLVAGKLLKP